MLGFGERAPSFSAPALSGNPRYGFDSAAGRPIVMLFLGSGRWAPGVEALQLLQQHDRIFDDQRASFFGVTVDPTDADEERIAQRLPGIRWFLDYGGEVSTLYGAAGGGEEGKKQYRPFWLLLDTNLRLVSSAPLQEGTRIFADLRGLIGMQPELSHAPVLAVPRVLEPALCRRLVELYEQNGGGESGFMRQQDGQTVGIVDHSFKRRFDYTIEDEQLCLAIRERLKLRLLPELERAFQFRATRIERWIVACYDADSGGYFRPHRDNTTSGTAHRNFACTINLNAEDYEGGELRFPEYGPRSYRAPTGGAIVFSCSLLHEALPVTRGKRYAFLPFFYDERGAEIRARNAATIVGLDGEAPAVAVG